jgi:Na+/H+ antiporter NhaD/arsenite permease-like protein
VREPKRLIAALVTFALLMFAIGALLDLPHSARYTAVATGVLSLVGALLFFVSSRLLERARVLEGSLIATPERSSQRSRKLFLLLSLAAGLLLAAAAAAGISLIVLAIIGAIAPLLFVAADWWTRRRVPREPH